MPVDHIAIVMPAFNEAEGIRGFVDEIREHVTPLAARVTFVVADDRPTDGTAASLANLDDVDVQTQPVNRGHGPTALAAWGLEQPGIERVELYVEPWNEGSWRTAEACGFHREGLLRSWERVGSDRKDMYMYSRLRPAPRA